MKKILMISKEYPYPQRCGFTVRLGKMCKYLSQYFDIHLLVDCYENSESKNDNQVFSDITYLKSSEKKNNIFIRMKNRAFPPYFDDPYYISDQFVNYVLELHNKNNYDICMIHTPIFARCIDALPDSVYKVVDTHDIWFQKYTEFEKIGYGKLLSQFRDKNRELDFYKRMDMIIAISFWDKDYLQKHGVENSIYVPVSFSPHPIVKETQFNNEVLYPAGNGLNNIDAINYFIQEVLPLVRKAIPDVKFKILNPCQEVKEKYANTSNVVFMPFQENIIDAYKQTDIVVIPLRVKSGLKIKLIESFSCGVPTILSSAAAQGVHLDKYAQETIPLSPECFAREVVKALLSPIYRNQLLVSGLNILKKYYSPDIVYLELTEKLSLMGMIMSIILYISFFQNLKL